MKKISALLLLLLPVVQFAQPPQGDRSKSLVFTHVTVIDATGAPAKPDMTVVIKRTWAELARYVFQEPDKRGLGHSQKGL
jgi:hypothetical protein